MDAASMPKPTEEQTAIDAFARVRALRRPPSLTAAHAPDTAPNCRASTA